MKPSTRTRYNKLEVFFTVVVLFLLITSTSFASSPVNVNTIAKDITRDVGIVKYIFEGDSEKILFVFEETHTSIIGQVEISIMLNRLFENYHMKYVGLEGFFSDKGQLIPSFVMDPPFQAGQFIGPREDTIVRLLEEGEISSSEMMAMVYSDISVIGIENESEYDYEPPESAWSACTIYLYRMAASGLTNYQIQRHNELAQKDDIMPLIEYTVGTNEFTKNMYARLNQKGKIVSVEEHVEMIDKIIEKENQMNVGVTQDDKENINALRKFFKIASDRSTTMVNNVLPLTDKISKSPVAMVIGAAHTEKTIKLLKKANTSFAIICNNSLNDDIKIGDLTSEGWDRKLKALSVDTTGTLGALLDGRRKPKSVLDQTWFQSKSNLYYLTTVIARSFDEGELPPFESTLESILPKLKNVTIDQNSIEVIDKDVIFSVEVLDNNSNPIKIWVRTKKDKDLADRTLEMKLSESLETLQKGKTKTSRPDQKGLILERVSSDTIAKFSTDPSAIRATTLGG